MECFQNYEVIIKSKTTSQEEKEEATLQILRELDTKQICTFLNDLPIQWKDLSLARTTKIIKKYLNTRDQGETTLQLVNDLINLYTNKKLLKIDLETRRIKLLLAMREYQKSLNLITSLIKELKKHDDKFNIINLYVFESKAYYEIKNLPRAKSSLTSARALSVSTFCPTELQAQIDMLSGMYICDEKNYETAYSYFLESLDGFVIEKMEQSVTVVRYLILCKIVGLRYNEIESLYKRLDEKLSKAGFNTSTDGTVKLLLEVNQCCIGRDLYNYKNLLHSRGSIICDTFIEKHLTMLYDRLLEENILKITEPYKNIRIDYIASSMELQEEIVEAKLRIMILDGRIDGILDSVGRSLILHDMKNKTNNRWQIDVIDDLAEYVSKIKN